jgi:hypothetical protein
MLDICVLCYKLLSKCTAKYRYAFCNSGPSFIDAAVVTQHRRVLKEDNHYRHIQEIGFVSFHFCAINPPGSMNRCFHQLLLLLL